MKLPDIQEVLQAAIEDSPHEVVAAYLYGSRARGTQRPDSDVDLAILVRNFAEGTLASLALDLEGDLEQRFGRAVQLLVLNMASPDLVHRVLRDGRLLVDYQPSERIRFEVASRNRYFDLLPFLNEYRRSTPTHPS
jgi:hypothetical protein